MSDAKECPFCGTPIYEKKAQKRFKTFFNRKEKKDTPFFNFSITIMERLMAACSYLLIFAIFPIVYYHKHPDEKNDFILVHMNQGILTGIVFVIAGIIYSVYTLNPALITSGLASLPYLFAVLFGTYAIIVVAFSFISILRGEHKHFPIFNKIKIFK